MKGMGQKILGGIAIALGLSFAGAAQAWPDRAISLLVGFPPGGNLDGIARILAPRLSEVLGKPIVIDNRAGAGGSIAAAQLLRAPPDGHTLYIFSLGHISSAILNKVPYDPVLDFSVAGMLASNPFTIAVSRAAPFNSIADIFKAAKEKPGSIDYGTAGIGTGMHLVAELMSSRAGIKLNHIPYKGGSGVQMAVLENEVPLIFSTPSVTVPFHQQGKIRVLAVTTRERYPGLPEVPTLSESGLAGFDIRDFAMVAAPKGTPEAVLMKINLAISQVMSQPDVRGQLATLGVVPAAPMSPMQAQKFLSVETERWKRVITDARITLGGR